MSSGQQSSCDADDRRSLWDIIWSCLVTTFACTWLSVHPNIPAPSDSWFKIALRRLGYMFWALAAPEVIILWAIRQWVSARRIARLRRENGWTLTHGFFLQMGGFMLTANDQPIRPLNFRDLETFYNMNRISWPNISQKEIEDRSKGDVFAKGVALAQTTWFIVQCLARGAQRIPITKLELVTVSFSVLNVIMYFFWWNKPLDVRCPVMVPLLVSEETGLTKNKKDDRKETDMLTSVFQYLADLVSASEVDEATKKMHPYYAEIIVGIEDPVIEVSVASSIVAIVFGAIHCVAWSFEFPTHIELVLWRAAAITTTLCPLSAILLNIINYLDHRGKISFGLQRLVFLCMLFMVVSMSILYVLSRMILLILALVTLRRVPVAVFKEIAWTSFAPHV